MFAEGQRRYRHCVLGIHASLWSATSGEPVGPILNEHETCKFEREKLVFVENGGGGSDDDDSAFSSFWWT